MSIKTGQPAPSFALYNSEKKIVELESYLGHPVLLLFFPLAFTSTCTRELCHVRDNLREYQNLQAVVLGISVDSVHSLARYKADQQLNFQLLSDFNKEVSRAYESIYEKFGYGMLGVSKRAAFVIDGAGILRYVEILENADELPRFEKIRECLQEINENLEVN